MLETVSAFFDFAAAAVANSPRLAAAAGLCLFGAVYLFADVAVRRRRRSREKLSRSAQMVFAEEGAQMILFVSGNKISDEQRGSAPLRLLFHSSFIEAVHAKRKISMRAAAKQLQMQKTHITVSRNIAWGVSDALLAAAAGQKVIPLGAAVWSCAEGLFGRADERTVIVTFARLPRPLTYVLDVFGGEVREEIIHGGAPACNTEGRNVCRIDVEWDFGGGEPPEFAHPHADPAAQITPDDFLRRIAVRPIAAGKDRPHASPVPAALAACLMALVCWALHSAARDIDGGARAAEARTAALAEKTEEINGEIRAAWRKALPAFVRKRRQNVVPLFVRADTAGRILPVKKITWTRESKTTEIAFDLPLSAGKAAIGEFRRKMKSALPLCELSESVNLEGTHEINFVVHCVR